MGVELRLSPAMASFEIAVLGFLKQYFGKWSRSPSYDEIVAGLGEAGIAASKSRVHKAVKRLAGRGEILRKPGAHRSIMLPDNLADAIRLLRQAGYRVDDDIPVPPDPFGQLGVVLMPETNPPLPVLLELEHIPDVEIGEEAPDAGIEQR